MCYNIKDHQTTIETSERLEKLKIEPAFEGENNLIFLPENDVDTLHDVVKSEPTSEIEIVSEIYSTPLITRVTENITCDLCSSKLANKFELKQHMKSHIHLCSYCSNNFLFQ